MSAFSLNKKVTTFMVYIALTLFGLMSLSNLAIDLMPSIEVPVAIVNTTYPGAGSAEIENMVTRPVEQAVARVSGIDTISSTSSEGVSTVVAVFTDDVDIDTAIIDMREKIDMVAPMLPDNVSTPIVMAIDIDAMPIQQISISGDASISTLESIANDTIAPKIERIAGVASVTVDGGYDNVVNIKTDGAKMRGYGISIDYVSNILRATNISMPSGEIAYGDKELVVRTDSEFSDIEDIKNVIIPLPRGGTISLSDIATVTLEAKEISTIAKVNGENVIILSVQKQSGVNTSQVAKKVNEEIKQLTAELPEIEFTTISDQSDFVNLAINSVMLNVMLGIVFSIFVLFLFLRKISPTLIIAISMPICLITTFLLMKGLNLTLNIMTLGGMAIGVGMIVDNSVVVLENIFRFREEGHDRYTACLEGAKEVSLSITASTITTIAVFLPIGLSGGMVGQIFNEFALTITSLLVSSLLIALTLVPLLAYILLDRGKLKPPSLDSDKKVKKPKKFTKIYQNILLKVLSKPKTALFTSFVLFIAFTLSVSTVGAELMPKVDQGMLNVSVKLPISSELSDTAAITDELVERMLTIEETETIAYTSSSNSSTIMMVLKDVSERDRTVFEVGDDVRAMTKDIAGAEISVSDGGSTDMSAMTGAAVSISLSGKDLDTLNEISDDIVDVIEVTEGAKDVKSSSSERVEQVNIKMNNEIATKYGLTPMAIASAVNAELQGVTATTLKMDGNEIDVVVKGDPYSKSSIDALKNLIITTQQGASVPLSMVADVVVELGAHTISRENQMRTITISAASSTDAFTLSQEVTKALTDYPLPDGYFLDLGGESEEIAETFSTLFEALIIAIALVYFVLASQFESLLLPFIVMLAMPLGLSGGIFGLFVTNTPLSMPSFLGVIMLSGIVVNNSIILIDYIKTRQENGEDIKTAIINACPLRVRPVLMTTLTTILGLLPMAFGLGEGSEMMTPMAIVMISGLTISTAITLIFSPLFYYLIKKPKTPRKKRSSKKEALNAAN